MREKKELLIGSLIFAACLAVLFRQALNTTGGAQASQITLEESQTLYGEFGGAPGTKPITMFVTSWCPVCTGLSKELTAMGIKFISLDVEKNREAMLFFHKATGGQTSSVPVTLVGNEIILGFNVSAIINAMQRLDPPKAADSKVAEAI